MNYIYTFLVASAVFAVIDLVWLGIIAKNFYRAQMGNLFAKKVKPFPAIAFYSLYIIGLIFFVLRPAYSEDSLTIALGYGIFFGLVTYATYDLTNWATTEKWPKKLAIVDMIWGGVLTGVVATITFAISNGWFQ